MSSIAKGNFTYRGHKMERYGLSIYSVNTPDEISNFGIATEVALNDKGQIIDSKEQSFEVTIEMAFKSKVNRTVITQVNRILFDTDNFEPLINAEGLVAYVKFIDGQIVYKNNLTYIICKAICMPNLYTTVYTNNIVVDKERGTFEVANIGISDCYAKIVVVARANNTITLSNNKNTITLKNVQEGQTIEIYETGEITGIAYSDIETVGNICKLIYGNNIYVVTGKCNVEIKWQCKMGRM